MLAFWKKNIQTAEEVGEEEAQNEEEEREKRLQRKRTQGGTESCG